MEEIRSELNSSLLLESTLFWRKMNSTIVAPDLDRNPADMKLVSNLYEWRFILPLYVMIFIASVGGNGVVVATLAQSSHTRTITNIYLVNLASSDIMLSIFCMPFTLIGQIYQQFMFGPIFCQLIPYLQAVAVTTEVWTLVAISLERYFAICCPLRSRKWQTVRHANKMIFIVWLFSVVVNAPILYVSNLQPVKGTDTFKCREEWPSIEFERAFNHTLNFILLIIPFGIMIFAYSLIVKKLWIGLKQEIQHNSNWQNQTQDTNQYKNGPGPDGKKNIKELNCKTCQQKKLFKHVGQDKKATPCPHIINEHIYNVVRSTHIKKSIESKQKVIRMLCVIMIEFFVCWTPLHLANTIYLYYPVELYSYIGSKGVMALQLLAYCASCTNPITYCFMNSRFRQHCIKLFKRCKIFKWWSKRENEQIQVIPLPGSSSQPSACVIKGHIERYEKNGQEAEDCV